MGGHPYHYFVPYEQDVSQALQKLRTVEFEAGSLQSCDSFPGFPY